MAIITGTPNNDNLVGTAESDNIRGLEGNDIISGLDGSDQLDGGTGNDSINGNQGNDSIFGGAGDDTLLGGQGDDLVVGEAGNDILAGEAGTNTLTGGVGRDTFVLTSRGTATITDFFAGDDFLGLTGDLTIDDIEVAQSFANTNVIDRRTGNVLATLNNVAPNALRVTNFVDEIGRPVSLNTGITTLVDVTATDPIGSTTNANDPIVFTISRTSTAGELTVNFTLATTAGVTLQNPPTSVRIPAGQQFANVLIRPQNNSGNGTVTITLQDAPNYEVRTGTATGTVSAPIPGPTPAPAPATPDAPAVVDLVLTRADIPATPSAGQPVTTTFNVFNRGTGKADRVELSANLPIDTRLVSVVPSQGVFTNLSGDTTRGGIVKVELGSVDPDRGATVVVTYVPNTTGNFVLTDARVTSAQPDVDPSNNFANAGFNIIPSPPVLPVISVVASNDGVAREPDTTQLEGTDRETETGLVVQEFIITRTGGDLTRPLTVNYTLEGTAQNGVDFNPIGSSVTFAPFQTEVVVTIRPVQDRQVEGTEFVRLNLVPNPLVYNVNEPEGRSSARIDIVDVPNPVGPAPLPGTVVSLVAIDQFADEFRPPSASGGSTPGAVSPIRGVLRVTRDNLIGDLTVNVEISGTANRPDEPASDYVLFDTLGRTIPVAGGVARITIPDGQQFIDVYLEAVDDPFSEGEEEALFNLAPGASYVIGRPQDIAADRPAVVRIRDNETPPTVTIVANTPFITEGQDIGIFQVIRTGDLSQPRTVIIEVSGSASPPRQIQRNNPPIPEDYAVTGSSVFLGDSNLTTAPNIANLGANRFLVTIPAGQDRTSILINPLADIVFDPREIIVARIVPPPNPQALPLTTGANLPEDIPPQGFIVVGGSAVMTILDPAGDNPIVGTAGNDTIIGTNGGDFILGLQGDNYLQGLKGDDIIIGIEGNDTILGDEGNDFLIAAAGNDLLIGGVGGDTLDGGPGIDTMIGEDGDDLYVVDDASDVVFELPNEGNDTVESSVNFILPPNFENLQLIGNAIQGTGNELDNVIVGNDQGNILNGLGGDDTIFGLGGADVVNGGDGDDSILGGSGDDNLSGGNGDDTILGEDGNDVISGGAGADSLSGEDGNDNITGGSGDDTITGGAGDDALDGGGGNDNINGGNGNDNIKGGDGIDTLVGGDGADTIDGGDGADTIVGGKGDDSLIGGDGDDTIDGGEGKDNISGGKGADSLIGGDGDDTIDGGEGADTIDGGVDNDSINGGDGADSILGGSGADTIDGGDDNDTIDGGADNDSINGGDGADSILGGFGADTIDGGDGADTIDGGSGADSISGGDGSDFILAGAGDDTIDGGAGNDTIDGGTDDDSITGGTGDDIVFGGSGADTIDGGAGDDIITGGAGADSLTGGAGNDKFLFSFPDDGTDTITDFNVTFDQIRAAGINFGGLLPGTLPLPNFLSGPGANVPSNPNHRFIYDTTTGELRFDPDGTGPQPTVLLAVLTGNPALANTNIVIF